MPPCPNTDSTCQRSTRAPARSTADLQRDVTARPPWRPEPPPARSAWVARAEAALETEQRILEAATALFAERYYDEISLDDVAAGAGVSTRTVVRRFGTKEALALRLIEGVSRHDGARRDAVAAGDVDAALRMILETYELFGDTLLRILSAEGRVPMVTAMAEEGRRLHAAWVRRVFGPRLPGGAAQPDMVLALLVVATDVYTWKLLRRDARLSASETADAARRLVDAILRPPESVRP